MATRNENIKKINDELELLSDEQLEEVAGGNSYDRGLLIDELKKNNLEKYLEPGKDNKEILINTCKKYGIGYDPSSVFLDKFEIKRKMARYQMDPRQSRRSNRLHQKENRHLKNYLRLIHKKPLGTRSEGFFVEIIKKPRRTARRGFFCESRYFMQNFFKVHRFSVSRRRVNEFLSATDDFFVNNFIDKVIWQIFTDKNIFKSS